VALVRTDVSEERITITIIESSGSAVGIATDGLDD
jgi:hypothetical protein